MTSTRVTARAVLTGGNRKALAALAAGYLLHVVDCWVVLLLAFAQGHPCPICPISEVFSKFNDSVTL